MKLGVVASVLLLARVNSAFTQDPEQWVSQWNQNDVKLFLLDRNIPFDQSSDPSVLSDLAVKELHNLAEKKKTILDVTDLNSAELLKAASDPNQSLDQLIVKNEVDYLGSGLEIKDWLFSSWLAPQLRSLLAANHISHSKKGSAPALLKVAQKNFDKITSNNDASGKYLGNWLFDAWSDSDLVDWLSRYDIEHKASDKRDDLIRSVKDHAFIVLQSLSDSKNALLDSLHTKESDLYDKSGNIKAGFFDTWSYSQLREWLYAQGLIDTKPGVYSKELLLESVKKMAEANAKYVKDDVSSWWLGAAEKTKETTDSFLDGIDKWQKLRLREFLKARKVDFHRFASKADLVKLVKEHRDKPASKDSVSFIRSWLLENLSTEAMQEWLKMVGQNTAGSRDELLVALLSYLASGDAVAKIPSTIKLQAKHYEPDFAHYRNYLVSKGVDLENAGEDTIKGTYELVKLYFTRAGSDLESKYDHSKGNVEDALQNAQDSAYDYALSSILTFKDDKESMENRLQKARDAADSYCKDAIDSLTSSYNTATESVASFAGYKHPNMPGFMRRWFGYVGLGEIVAGRAKTIYMSGPSSASLHISSAYKDASLVGAEGALYASGGYDTAALVASDGYDAVSHAAVAGKLYASQGYDTVSLAVVDGALMASDGYEAASRAAVAGKLYASEGYDTASLAAVDGALMASDGYEAASRMASDGYEAASQAAVAGKLYASEGYDTVSLLAVDGALYASDGYEAASQAAVVGKLYASEGYDTVSLAAVDGALMASEGYDAASLAAVDGVLYASDGYNAAVLVASDGYEAVSLVASDGALYASDGFDAASSVYSQAAKAAPTYISSGSEAMNEAYNQGSVAAAAALEHASGIIDAAGSYAAAATDLAKDMADRVEDGWTYLLKSWSNSDLRSYLQSFGYDHSTLYHMNRRQLLGLANQQSSFFHGSTDDKWHMTVPQFIKDSAGIFHRKPRSMWEKPITELFAEAYDNVLHAAHIR